MWSSSHMFAVLSLSLCALEFCIFYVFSTLLRSQMSRMCASPSFFLPCRITFPSRLTHYSCLHCKSCASVESSQNCLRAVWLTYTRHVCMYILHSNGSFIVKVRPCVSWQTIANFVLKTEAIVYFNEEWMEERPHGDRQLQINHASHWNESHSRNSWFLAQRILM